LRIISNWRFAPVRIIIERASSTSVFLYWIGNHSSLFSIFSTLTAITAVVMMCLLKMFEFIASTCTANLVPHRLKLVMDSILDYNLISHNKISKDKFDSS
jgi:hypothetical protein